MFRCFCCISPKSRDSGYQIKCQNKAVDFFGQQDGHKRTIEHKTFFCIQSFFTYAYVISEAEGIKFNAIRL